MQIKCDPKFLKESKYSSMVLIQVRVEATFITDYAVGSNCSVSLRPLLEGYFNNGGKG